MNQRLVETTCKRCGKKLSTMAAPIHSSAATMNKWNRICSSCITDQERMQMMIEMNNDVKAKCEN